MGRLVGDLKERTLRFGVDVLSAVAGFPKETIGWTVGKQLARSATSIGANVWEANAAVSDADFANKIGISHKEANETLYWLELARRSQLLDVTTCDSLQRECDELVRILLTIIRKTNERTRL